jgi:hypothetical protein
LFLSVRVLSRLFRRRFLEELQNAHRMGRLRFFGEYIDLADAEVFAAWLMPMRQVEWVVYAKRPFSGPQAVLFCSSRRPSLSLMAAPITAAPDQPSCADTAAHRCSSSRPSRVHRTSGDHRVDHDPASLITDTLPGTSLYGTGSNPYGCVSHNPWQLPISKTQWTLHPRSRR